MTRCGIPYEKNFKLKKIETYRQTGVIVFTKKKKELLNFSRLKELFRENTSQLTCLGLLKMGIKSKHIKLKKE